MALLWPHHITLLLTGGFKYNPPNGGPADTDATNWIASRANELLYNNNIDVKSLYFTDAIEAEAPFFTIILHPT